MEFFMLSGFPRTGVSTTNPEPEPQWAGSARQTCRVSAARVLGERSLPWPRLQLLLQLLGANWIFVSRSYPGACHFSPQTQLRHEEFVEVLFAVLAQLEAGSDAQVIRPRDAVVKSKACALL
ncbi:unnamed protein product [Effrenium voratum]|nr:unnamed protein product [Effrenium voratum]